MGIKNMLDERNKTHGNFAENAKAFEKIMGVFSGLQLDHCLTFGLTMIASKLVRIANGDSKFVDHYRDIEGYAKLVADHLESLQTETADKLPTVEKSARKVKSVEQKNQPVEQRAELFGNKNHPEKIEHKVEDKVEKIEDKKDDINVDKKIAMIKNCNRVIAELIESGFERSKIQSAMKARGFDSLASMGDEDLDSFCKSLEAKIEMLRGEKNDK